MSWLALVSIMTSCTVSSARFTGPDGSGTPIGDSSTLSIAVAGSGDVSWDGKTCPDDCSETFGQHAAVELTATSIGDATLSGWTGACSGASSVCDVSVDESMTVLLAFSATLAFADRQLTYTRVSIDNGIGATMVAPGETVSLAYDVSVSFDASTGYCPGCIVQSYVGIGGTSDTLQCEADIYDGYTSTYHSGTFTAPTTPGIYYLTQVGTLDYSCKPRDFPNDAEHSIAVLVVQSP